MGKRNQPIEGGLALIFGALVLIGLIGVTLRLAWRSTAPPFVRVQRVPSQLGSCQVEVWLAGRPGDRLTRLVQHGKLGRRWTTRVALMRSKGISAELPGTAKTAAGECSITRYHLLVDGVEVESVDF